MKILYLDCGMGAAGDMLTAALLGLFPQSVEIVEELNALEIPHVHFRKRSVKRCGVEGNEITVTVHGKEECEDFHEHSHNNLHGIEHILSHINISEKNKSDIMAVYKILADAESKAHGVPVSEIHFHEVGNMDAVADITAVCLLMDKLQADKVIVSPIHVGSGQVRCAHGVLPVPAPATAYILQGCPIYGGEIKGELCTPTGAALLKYFADEFGNMPIMKLQSIGYGMGKKNFETVNCVRAMIGENS